MKHNRLFCTVLLAIASVCAYGQLSQEELNKMDNNARVFYLNQSKQIKETLEYQLFKAEDMIKMGEEMNREEGNKMGPFYIAKGMELKEKAIKDAREAQARLDKAAREGIRGK